jgi:hypothetical protein
LPFVQSKTFDLLNKIFMRKMLLIVALLISGFAFGQTKQQRTVADFSGISTSSGIETEITQGTENSVFISANDDSYLDKIITEVENGTLKIYVDSKKMKWNKRDKNYKIKAIITYKSINRISASSGSSLRIVNPLTTPSLTVDVSSGAGLSGEINVTELAVDQSSGAISKLKGSATNMKASLSSGAVFTGTDLLSEACRVTASSGAILKISVSKSLIASASSGAVISYRGNPSVEKNTGSGGVLNKF